MIFNKLLFQAKLATANLVSTLTSKRGITVHTLMPVEITEPVDKAKNIVGMWFKKF